MKDRRSSSRPLRDYVTVDEYKTRNQVSEGKTRVWYAASEDTR